MSIPLSDASALMVKTLLIDRVDIYQVKGTHVEGFKTVVDACCTYQDEPALVQTVALQSGEDLLMSSFSVKVGPHVNLIAGDRVKVISCEREPDLVGVELLVDQVSYNGLSLLRKGVATIPVRVDGQGKGAL